MAWEDGVSIATRQRCGVCQRVSPVGFKVSDELWLRAVPSYFRETPMCISCFASFADERMLEWCADITFYPKSLAAHRIEAATPTEPTPCDTCHGSRHISLDGPVMTTTVPCPTCHPVKPTEPTPPPADDRNYEACDIPALEVATGLRQPPAVGRCKTCQHCPHCAESANFAGLPNTQETR